MKKLPLLLAALIALSVLFSACAPAAQPAATATPAATAPESTDVPADLPEATPDLNKVRTDVEAMMPILDSIVCATGINATDAYNPENPEFVWSVLYLMGVNWGDTHPLVEETDECIIVKRQVMQEFASAAFFVYSDLPEVPESMAASVQYDEALDAYKLAYSDRGDSGTKLGAFGVADDGTVTANVDLYEAPDTKLGTFEFTLAPNIYAAGITDSIYQYSVSGITMAVPEA